MKKLICVLMIVAVMIGLTACGGKNIEGTWTINDGNNGYKFEKLGKRSDGETMGRVTVLPEEKGVFAAAITYYYRFTDDNKVEILRSSPSFVGNGVGVEEMQYDILSLEKEDGKSVLISEKSGKSYYQQKD